MVEFVQTKNCLKVAKTRRSAQPFCVWSVQLLLLIQELFRSYDWGPPAPNLERIVCKYGRTAKTTQNIYFNLSVPNTACYIPNAHLPAIERPPFRLTDTEQTAAEITLTFSQSFSQKEVSDSAVCHDYDGQYSINEKKQTKNNNKKLKRRDRQTDRQTET